MRCNAARRVAAITVAKRVAEEMDVPLGGKVGYKVRFDNTTSTETRVKYMTDGMLLREAMVDASLQRYGFIVLDEAHERTLHTDILIGVVKAAQKQRNRQKRSKLIVIVMSATLSVGVFRDYFLRGNPGISVGVVRVPGRQHPVETYFTEDPQEDHIDAVVATVLKLPRKARG